MFRAKVVTKMPFCLGEVTGNGLVSAFDFAAFAAQVLLSCIPAYFDAKRYLGSPPHGAADGIGHIWLVAIAIALVDVGLPAPHRTAARGRPHRISATLSGFQSARGRDSETPPAVSVALNPCR
jgi:hypothetical protein